MRGSTPCSCDSNRRYGGNTSCVAIEWPDRDPILLDLGTGLRFFGLTPTSMKLEGLDRHQRLIDSYQKLHVARAKVAALSS